MNSMRLKTKFIILLVMVFAAAFAANAAWTDAAQRAQMERELRERGEVIALQMQQTWNYLVESQDQVAEAYGYAYAYDPDYAPDYTPNYTVIDEDNCAVAGRTISVTFTDASRYVTRYVNTNPRNPDDVPDTFEELALSAFRAMDDPQPYYEIAEYDGRQVFRYTEPMLVTELCLDCHGGPKGSLDVTGHVREGLGLGDVAGAVSVVVPMDSFVEAERQGVTRNLIIFAVLLGLVLAIIYLALTRLVTVPLGKVEQALVRAGAGDLSAQVSPTLSSREMNSLAAGFNEMARELSELYSNLETQVADRTAQLVEANAVLERQRVQLQDVNEQLRNENRYKTEFLSIVSHELRTPLTSILAFANMIADEPGLDDQGKTARREIEANSRVLLLMINDILDMNRLDAGREQLSVQAVDVSDLLNFIEPIVSPIARQSQIDFDWSMEPGVPVIQGDFDKLAHALENLALNAVKFTPEGGSIRIAASYDAAERMVRIAVSDTGIGIAPEDQQRVFERFVQVDSSTTRKYNGTGLGLPLARKYAELHGGRLELESQPGAGSTFTVVVPADSDEGVVQ